MAIDLMYITNRPEIARIAEKADVDRIFIDMEYIGKGLRQGGMDTVQNHHTIDDIRTIRKCVTKSKVQVRINPIHEAIYDYFNTEDEVHAAIDAGADILMLPMYKTVADVERFVKAVNGKVTTLLLAETIEAADIMQEVVKITEVDEIHLGLNDMHLAKGMKFMFELLADGTVDELCNIINPSGKKYGFGGIARLGYGTLPAEKIIMDHYRIGSTMAILSRSFCNVDKIEHIDEIRDKFTCEVARIREAEKEYAKFSMEDFDANHQAVIKLVNQIKSTL